MLAGHRPFDRPGDNDTLALTSRVKTMPLPPGEAPGPGQYVVHDTGLVHTPYLPDVLARGLGFVFPDAGKEWTMVPPFGVEGFTARYAGVEELSDIPDITIQQIEHFFTHYKDLEPGKWVKFIGWGGSAEAKQLIVEAIERARTA